MALLGIDLGTSSVKVMIVDSKGITLSQSKADYPVISAQPGWAESEPDKWWQAVVIAVKMALTLLPQTKITAIGLSGQMHGVVLVNSAGQPLHPAILWPDTRSQEQITTYQALPASIRQRLANPLVPGMAGPILVWLARHEPATYQAAKWALQPKDWLRLRLTGDCSTDPSDASATLLYDLLADEWAEDVIEKLGLKRELFPPIQPSDAIAGGLSKFAADGLGLPVGLPVAVGAGDTPAAALGTGLLEPGQIQVTMGTGAQVIQLYREAMADPNGRVHLYRTADRDTWYGMAAVQNGGLALDWVRRTLGMHWEELYACADMVAPGTDGLTFLPFLVHERAHQPNSQQGGAFLGLRSSHKREHMLQAALEGVALGIRVALEALPVTNMATSLRLAGGGSVNQVWRQMLANILGKELVAVDIPGASSRGAALLGGIATGTWSSVRATAAVAPNARTVAIPDPEKVELYNRVYAKYQKLTQIYQAG